MCYFEEKYKKVSKEEFDRFVREFPRTLTKHDVRFITPSVTAYCDFESGKEYPDCVVAQIHNDSELNDSLNHTLLDNEYFIVRETEK